jgi:nitronate monooxygenase
LGVVSGTGLSAVIVRRLQDGDLDGSVRRALNQFPDQPTVEQMIKDYYIPGGKRKEVPYKLTSFFSLNTNPYLEKLTAAATFAEVFLAKEGHNGAVGINFLEKTQLSNLPGLYGALLAGVNYVIMGAGIPREIPTVLEKLANHEPVSYPIYVIGADAKEPFSITFSPLDLFPEFEKIELKRPLFLAIVSSNILADSLAKKNRGHVDGFIVEYPSAGGHNAPPRGPLVTTELGEPQYCEKDKIDLEKIRDLDRPFWLAGGFSTPEKLDYALSQGAKGVQVGTLFAFSEESGLDENIKRTILARLNSNQPVTVFTDPVGSPSGFPFKVVGLETSVSNPTVYNSRTRMCDLGFLRNPYKGANGKIGYRCPAEPVTTFVKKGGKEKSTEGKLCLCNGLMAAVGMAQSRWDGFVEPSLVTSGDELKKLKEILPINLDQPYHAQQILDYLKRDQAQTST